MHGADINHPGHCLQRQIAVFFEKQGTLFNILIYKPFQDALPVHNQSRCFVGIIGREKIYIEKPSKF
jgi:hypothetical protein